MPRRRVRVPGPGARTLAALLWLCLAGGFALGSPTLRCNPAPSGARNEFIDIR